MRGEGKKSCFSNDIKTTKQRRPPMPIGLVGRDLGQGPEVLAFGSALRQYMPPGRTSGHNTGKAENRRTTLPEVTPEYQPVTTPQIGATLPSMPNPNNASEYSCSNWNNQSNTSMDNNGQWQQSTWTPLGPNNTMPQPNFYQFPQGGLPIPRLTYYQAQQCMTPMTATNNYYGGEIPYGYGAEYPIPIGQEHSQIHEMDPIGPVEIPLQPAADVEGEKKAATINLASQLKNLQYQCELIQQTMDQERRKLNGIRSACEGLVREMQAAGFEDNATTLMEALHVDSAREQQQINNSNGTAPSDTGKAKGE